MGSVGAEKQNSDNYSGVSQPEKIIEDEFDESGGISYYKKDYFADWRNPLNKLKRGQPWFSFSGKTRRTAGGISAVGFLILKAGKKTET